MKRLQRRTLVINGTLAVLLLTGVGLSYASIRGVGGSAEATPPTTTVARGTVLDTVSASGSVQSAKTRDLNFGTSGTVEKINVEPGDKVEKGDVLARLDDDSARDDLAAAEANLAAAEAGDTSSAEGESTLISAQNAYDNARRQLAGTVLEAPYDGTITAVNGTVGSSSSGGTSSSTSDSSDPSSDSASDSSSGAAPGGGTSSGSTSGSTSDSDSDSSSGSAFMSIADTAKLAVEADFTEADVTELEEDQPATVSFEALPDTQAQGEVAGIDPSSHTDNNVVRYGVTVRLADVPKNVRLGQTATAEVVTAKADDVRYLPSSAVQEAGGQHTVTVLRDGRQVTRQVQVGIEGAENTEIVSGLREGDEVVLSTEGAGTGLPGGFPGGGGGLGGLRGGAVGGGAR